MINLHFLKSTSHLPYSKHGKFTFLLGLLGIAAFAILIINFIAPNIKYEYEEKIGSLLWSILPDQEREERITIIAIDESSLGSVGPWPWSRETMAKLSDQLAQYNTSLQLYDIVFPEPKEGDSAFLAALTRNHGILAQIPIFDHQSSLHKGVLSGALESTRCQYPIPNASSYLANSSTLLGSESKIGHITPIVDNDGVIRKQPPLICIEGRVYPSLALQGLLSSINKKIDKVSIQNNAGFQSSNWQVSIDSYFGLSIPIDKQGNMRLSYRQSPNSFQIVSAASVLNGTAPKEILDGSWALIGATAFGLGDLVPTPHNGRTPGVELQARLLSNLLDGKTPYTPSYSGILLFLEAIIAGGILLLLAQIPTRLSAYALPIATILLPIWIWGIHTYLLSNNIWLGWLSPALFSLIAGILFVLSDQHILRHQNFRIFSHLSSYLPKTVAHSLLYRNPTGAIEANRHDLVLLCADLRNFSAFEESRPPEEAAALLHCFFVEATALIETHGGQVEEYKGDSLLASWKGDPLNSASSAALEAADALQQMLSRIIPKRPPKDLEPLALGIAIERGPTLVGSIGPAHRRHHTLLGDTVTIVLRIQEMTQDLAQPILIGECAARDLHGTHIESQGSFLLDGLTTPHVLFAPRSHHIDPLIDKEDNLILRVVRKHSN